MTTEEEIWIRTLEARLRGNSHVGIFTAMDDANEALKGFREAFLSKIIEQETQRYQVRVPTPDSQKPSAEDIWPKAETAGGVAVWAHKVTNIMDTCGQCIFDPYESTNPCPQKSCTGWSRSDRESVYFTARTPGESFPPETSAENI